MKKKLLSIILTVAMLATMCANILVPSAAGTDGSISIGTADNTVTVDIADATSVTVPVTVNLTNVKAPHLILKLAIDGYTLKEAAITNVEADAHPDKVSINENGTNYEQGLVLIETEYVDLGEGALLPTVTAITFDATFTTETAEAGEKKIVITVEDNTNDAIADLDVTGVTGILVVEEAVEECDHANATLEYDVVDGNCVTTKVCPDCENEETIASQAGIEITPSLNLSAGLAVRFRISKNSVTGTDVYGIINHDVYSDDTTISGTSDDKNIVPTQTGSASNPRYQFEYTGLAAREMLSEIHVQIFATDANGNVILIAATDCVLADSLKTYANTAGHTYRTLAADILRYGAESQKAFSYRTGVLPTVGVDETAFSTLPTTFTNTDVTVGEGSTITLEPSAVLSNTVTLRFRFPVITGVDASDLRYTVNYISAAGADTTYESVDGEMGYNGNKSKYQFEFSSLPVAIINDYYTITVYNGDTALGSMKLSFQSTANTYYNNNSTYKALAQAICAYSASAAAVFKS